MNASISPHDWEALSAYRDNQLNSREHQLIESRLKEEPDLRQALDELEKTCHALKSAPRLQPPRNFTLTAEMVGGRPRKQTVPSFYSGLRLASILAAFFFVLITAGSLIVRTSSSSEPVVMQSVPQSPAPALVGKGGSGAVEAPAPRLAPTEEALNLQMEPSAEPPKAFSIQVTPMDENGVMATQSTVQAFAMPPEAAKTDEAVSAKQPPPAAAPAPSEESAAHGRDWKFLTTLQIALALVALITGFAAVYSRGKASR